MGLDCYIVKGNRDEVFKDERLENCTLVGGMAHLEVVVMNHS